MAPPAGTLRVGRYFLALLALLALLYAIVGFGSRQTPKLGIDLAGGTEVVFRAHTTDGKPPTRDSLNEARNILAERVNGTGVTESTVQTQGNEQLVVSIPGQKSPSLKTLGAAAVLNFRGNVIAPVPISCSHSKKAKPATYTPPASTSSPTSTGTPSASASDSTSSSPSSAPKTSKGPSKAAHTGQAAAVRPLAKPTPSGGPSRSTGKSAPATGKSSPNPAPSGSSSPAAPPSSSSPPAPSKCSATSVADAAKSGKFTVPLTDADTTKLSSTNPTALTSLQQALSNFDCSSAQSERDLLHSYYVACDGEPGTAGRSAYLLGPVVVPGHEIDTASAVEGNGQNGSGFGWSISLDLKSTGQSSWADYTQAHNVNNSSNTTGVNTCGATATPCADYVSFTLDGNVISSPVNETAINGGATQISGQFTQQSATDLANQLKYGALPVSFKFLTANSVSATLGTQQLKAGLLAGGIGLILVVLYSLVYYRGLGLVTIASLLVSGGLTYGALVMLSTQIGYTLSLAGVAGFIVAVGITADSFVVFFERLKDEVHEGRSARVAVPRAWVRARRTILSADTVSFLAAAVLYYFTTADVRGFAFTLGLSTILDLIVVFLFTHPMVSLLARSEAFGSARFTGLDAVRGIAAPDEAAPRTRPARSARTEPEERDSKFAGTAVLEKPSRRRERTQPPADEPAEQPTDKTVAEPVDEAIDEPVAEPADEAPSDDEATDSADSTDESPRRRTAPEPGSAAERAAARRARLREQRNNEKGRD